MPGPHWIVFDVSLLAWRAYHSIGHGDPLASALLTIHDMERIRTQIDRAGVPVFAFDKKPYHRKADFPGYKIRRGEVRSLVDMTEEDFADQQSREDMVAYVGKMRTGWLERCGYTNIFGRTGFEADDFIAAVCESTGTDQVTIVSRDSDLNQLLSRRVKKYDPVTGHYFTHHDFRDSYGLHPSQWCDVRALCGCRTDEIPGAFYEQNGEVRFVGETSALDYVRDGKCRLRAARIALDAFAGTSEHTRNMKLVTLPYPGTGPAIPELTGRFDAQEWRKLCAELEREPLADAVYGESSVRYGGC